MNVGPQSPWGMPPNNGNKGQNQQNNEPPKNHQKDPKQNFNNFSNKFKNFFFGDQPKSPKSVIGLIILGTILFWLSLGFYKVDADENAVVLYFGKFYSITTPGLNYHIPYPFGQVIKKSVSAVNTEEFGADKTYNLMLTGDENIVDIEFQVQWQISDIKDFAFNLSEPNNTIHQAAESAMREIIARKPITDALSDGKRKIELEAKELLQQILDSYGAGVRVVLLQLRRVDPPSQVIDSFRDVQTAKADKEKEINEAQAYANDVVPRARGLASQMLEEAEAYSKEVVSNAEGEAGRFTSVYNQYVKSQKVTKKRIYLETMEKIYRENDKIFIDKSAAKAGVMPYYPLNELTQQNKTKNESKN